MKSATIAIAVFLMGFIILTVGTTIMAWIAPPERLPDLLIGAFAMLVGGMAMGAAIQSSIDSARKIDNP